MNKKLLITERRKGVGLITLNNQDNLNALSKAMTDEIRFALKDMGNDEAVKVVVLTGVGKAFCVGVDLKELASNEAVLDDDTEFVAAFTSLKKPLIGAINGYAVTGGLEMALCCDFLYAAETAKFADTHSKVGLMPTWGMSQRLPRLIGVSRAKELSYSGKFFSAQEAQQWGMVNEVFPADELLEKTLSIAEAIANNVQESVMGMKSLIQDGMNCGLKEALEMEDRISRSYNDSLDKSKMESKLNEVRSNRK